VKAKPRYVLDIFAVLAYLQKETGEAPVQSFLERAARAEASLLLCLVNLGEVAYIVERQRGHSAAEAALGLIQELPIAIITADRVLTLAAAHIKAQFPLSYADAFAAALAEQQQATLLTGDAEFHHVEHLISISWLPTK
jgi:predicted nucleic acid-binding protein